MLKVATRLRKELARQGVEIVEAGRTAELPAAPPQAAKTPAVDDDLDAVVERLEAQGYTVFLPGDNLDLDDVENLDLDAVVERLEAQGYTVFLPGENLDLDDGDLVEAAARWRRGEVA
jgi:uncharacterized protein YcgL (UPF0745 family)